MSTKRYPAELKERAVRMVLEAQEQDPTDKGAINRIAAKLGVGSPSLRTWVDREKVDTGKKPGTTTADAARIKELERENKELRRTNEILKAASAFFAQEADPHRRT
jgi:transposase